MRDSIQTTNEKLLSTIMIAFLEDDKLAINVIHTNLSNRYSQNLVSLEEIKQVYSWFIGQ